MTRRRLPIFLLLAAALGGCMSHRRFPAATLERALVPDLGRLSEADIQRLLRARVVLPTPARAGIVWVSERSNTGEATLPEAERTRLMKRLAEALERPPFASVSIIPTATTDGGRGEDLELAGLRSAAARFQDDVLVLVSVQRNEYVDWNPLALSYLAVLPLYLVPGDDVAVYASAEACALDVQSGVFLACAQGQGRARSRFVTSMGQQRRLRALATEALERALARVPTDLQAGVRTRLDRVGSSKGDVAPVGQPYETVDR